MDKITHQVRAKHWVKIMNECINSGMSKTAWLNITVRRSRQSGVASGQVAQRAPE